MKKNKAIDMAIKYLTQIDSERYKGRADAARYGIRFGILASEHHEEILEIIRILESLKDE